MDEQTAEKDIEGRMQKEVFLEFFPIEGCIFFTENRLNL